MLGNHRPIAVCCVVLVLQQSASAENVRPNIILFLVDDMGVMDTSVACLTDAEGKPKRYPLNDFYRTPHMQRLAKRGVRFSQFYAMSVCSPTRITLMTGQNAARHRTTNWINPRNNNRGPQGPPDWNWTGLDKQSTTLPKLLQQAGYETIHVGKGHFGPTGHEGADPNNLGFQWNVGGASFGAPGSYYGEKNYGLGTRRAHHAVPHLANYHGTDTFLTEALTIEAKKRLQQATKANKPFFLYMSHYAVHAPFDSDPRFADHYRNSGKPANAQAFATLIEGMDKSLGDLLDQLDELKIAENTLVLFLGDNGSDAPLGHQHAVACAAPLRGKKGAHYEGGMRVPFIAAWARPDSSSALQQRLPIAPGRLQTQVGSVQDIFPTLLQLLNVRPPAGHQVDGLPLQSLLTGKKDESRPQRFLMHYPHAPHRSHYFTCLRVDNWKVVYHYIPSAASGNSHYQLFDLKTDPFEQRDLSQERPEVLSRMMQQLIAELETHQAVYPVEKGNSRNALLPKLPSANASGAKP